MAYDLGFVAYDLWFKTLGIMYYVLGLRIIACELCFSAYCLQIRVYD